MEAASKTGDLDAKGEKDYDSTKKDDETTSGAKAYNKYPNKGDEAKDGGKAYSNPHHKIKEDSGDKEGERYDDDRMSDDDHIKAIEHHLAALRGDRDYDEDHIDERRGRGRKGPSTRGVDDARLREAIEKALKASIKRKKA